ncbi:hypothetical protein WME76_07835 [Sorangium sp. So ce119]|uniref:hypothetical protein n=1 Tax=Sorangium sp. So ce119 TaxID=3133279 RepID=UPI003F601BD6
MRAPRGALVAAGARSWLCAALAGACCAGAAGCAEGARPAPASAARGASAAQDAPGAPTAQGASAGRGASAATAASAAPAGALPASPPADPGRSGEAPPRERWVGALELTKGAQPMIAGRIMSREDAERWLGPDWRALRGQRVRVLAVLRDHVCEPHAQCLSGGRIPLLEQVASVDLCSGAGPAVPDRVDCAPSPAQIARCNADCRSLGADCDQRADDRGALRRCGCARVACEQGCGETGEPSFTCR